MEYEYANYKIIIDGKAIAYCITKEDAESRCKTFRRQGFDPIIVFAPKCRKLFG